MLAQLPQELIDEIIDYLHGDMEALHACSLVSHVLMHRSRFHLFYDSYLPKRSSTWLKPGSCPVPELIKWVEIFGYGEQPLGHLQRYTNLRSLILVTTDLLNLPKGSSLQKLYPFPHLESLEVRGCTFIDTLQFAQLLCNFPRLDYVKLSSIYFSKDYKGELDNFRPITPPFSRSLKIDDSAYYRDGGEKSLADLLTLAFPGSLHFRSIDLHTVSKDCTHDINKLLRACGSDLEYLALTLVQDSRSTDKVINLAYNDNLREIRASRVDGHLQQRLKRMAFLPMISSLSQLATSMAFISLCDTTLQNAEDWTALDTLLGSNDDMRFRNLRRVVVYVRDHPCSVGDWGKMPLVQARGLLRFG